MNSAIIVGADALDLLRGFRLVRCGVCGGADCLGAVGMLCNSQRMERGRAPVPAPAVDPAMDADPRQLALWRVP